MAVRLKVKIKLISEEMTGQKVGYIAGLDGYTEESSPEQYDIPQEPVMIMQDFSSSQIDQLLAFFRNAGIPRIALKAMLTDHNKDWYFYELYKELKREHEYFEK